MSVHLGELLKMIGQEAQNVSKLMSKMKGSSGISVKVMLQLQMAMNKFSQITDLGSTTISLFNQSVKTAIQNILR